MHDAGEMTFVEDDDYGIIRYRVIDGVPQPPAANDYIAASLVTAARRYTGHPDLAPGIRFAHAAVPYLDEYQRFFRTTVSFNAPYNTIAIARKVAMSVPTLRRRLEAEDRLTL